MPAGSIAPASPSAAAASQHTHADHANLSEEKENHAHEGNKMTTVAASATAGTPVKGASIVASASSASSKAKKSVVWDDEDDAAANDANAPRAAAASHTMTLDAIRRICKTRGDLYENLELNEKLFLNFGSFDTIDQLEHFPDLKSLWLENNLFTTLLPIAPATGLAPLSSLRCLYLQNNRLTSLAGVESLTALVLLNVSSNELTSLAGLSALKHLQILDAHANQITDVSELGLMQEHKYLHTLDLSQNQIAGAEAVVEDAGAEPIASHTQTAPPVFVLLSQLAHLRVVYMKQNPVVESVTQYRRMLSSMLPALSFLDDRPVSTMDRACAVAWKEGGTERERNVRQLTQQEKREKEERNMREWMKQKEERVAQLAAIKAAQPTAAAAAASPATTDDATSSDPHLVRRVYHASSAPIPASPYHAEVAAVEYSSWVIRQAAIEEEDAAERAQAKKDAREKAKAKSAAAAAETAAAAAAAAAVPVEPLSTSSYLDADASDDPEIVAMKRMLHDVLLSTAAMKAPTDAKPKRSHNIGVSESALVDEQEVDAAVEREAAQASAAAAAASVVIPNLVAEASRPTVAAASASASSSGSTTPTGPNDAPNNFSILDAKTIAQIYEETKVQLPTVAGEDEDDEEDVSDAESEDDESAPVASASPDLDDVDAPTVKSPSSGSSGGSGRKSARKLPKILGFGPDDGHLINRPFFGSATGAASAAAAASIELSHEDEDGDWALAHIPAVPVAATKGVSLADLLEARRAARLGSEAKAKSVASRSRRPVRSAGAGVHSDLEHALAAAAAAGPSSMATGITAESLLTSFIQAQSSPPPASSSSEAVATPAVDTSAGGERIATQRALLDQSKSELFLAASQQLDHRRTSDSDEDDEDESDEDILPVDTRALAQEARRQARQQQGGR